MPMSFADRFARLFRTLLPSPFAIAIGLTVVTFWLAWFSSLFDGIDYWDHTMTLLGHWKAGVSDAGGLQFAMQMMLMLVLGHALALTRPVNVLIDRMVQYCNSTAVAAALVTFLTVLVALFNWGLGLIFGAVFARKVGEHAAAKGIPLNYALIGAAGYSGLMVWHGGISGSSLSKVNEPGHLKGLVDGLVSDEQLAMVPEVMDFSETVFSPGNVAISLVLLLVLPLGMYVLGQRVKSEKVVLPEQNIGAEAGAEMASGAERLDHAAWPAILFAVFVLGYVVYEMFWLPGSSFTTYFNPNNINFLLLGLCLLMHGSFNRFLGAVGQAMGGAAGILIQFPLYFGIMGMMYESGLVLDLSDYFVNIASGNPDLYPFLTFISAGLVNIFVPSGGGQWAVQGQLVVTSALELGNNLPKCILALAYGDQLTNMLQPFWALPLLGITGLKAKQILPFTLFLMVLGGAIFAVGLWLL